MQPDKNQPIMANSPNAKDIFSPFLKNRNNMKLLITIKSSSIEDKLSNFKAKIDKRIVTNVIIKIVEFKPALNRTRNSDK